MIEMNGLKKIHIRRIIYILMAVTFGLQLLVCRFLEIKYAGDAAIVYRAAGMQLHGTLDYYEIIYLLNNPNNLGMLYIDMMGILISDIIGADGRILLGVMGMALAVITSYFASDIVYRITGSSFWRVIGYAVTAFMVALNPWCSVAYTDVFSILLPVLMIWLYVNYSDDDKRFVRMMAFILTAGVAGVIIKPTNIFPVIAIVIVELIRKRTNARMILRLVICIAVAFVIMLLLKSAMRSAVNYHGEEEYRKPWTHYVMMGLNDKRNGRYSRADDDYTNSFDSQNEKMKANIELIGDRLSDMGPVGYVEFLGRKFRQSYGDGSFAWGIWSKGYEDIPLRLLRQVIWIAALVTGVFETAVCCKMRDRREAVMVMTGIMYMLYLLAFEAGARYLYLYSSLYLAIGLVGMNRIYQYVIVRRRLQEVNQ